MYKIVEECRDRVGDKGTTIGYGHLGDGNLHLNILVNKFNDEMESLLEPWIYERTQIVNGSISAEHGIGIMKPNVLHFTKNQNSISWMKNIKQIFDKNYILNPYKVLPH